MFGAYLADIFHFDQVAKVHVHHGGVEGDRSDGDVLPDSLEGSIKMKNTFLTFCYT